MRFPISFFDIRIALHPRTPRLFKQTFAASEPPAVLLRPLRQFGIGAERLRGVQRPVGIEQRLAADGDEVGAALLQRLLGLLRGEDQADRHGRDTGFFPDPIGERQLEARDALDQGSWSPRSPSLGFRPKSSRLRRLRPPSAPSQARRCLRCSSRPPRRRSTSSARRAAWMPARPCALRATTCSGKRMRSSSEPPYSSRARVGERRKKRVQEIAVGGMDLEDLEARGERAAHRVAVGRRAPSGSRPP